MSDLLSAPSVPPPPPPPPLLPLESSLGLKTPTKLRKYVDASDEIDSHTQFEKKRHGSLLDPTIFRRFRDVAQIPQDGPTCGMVALSSGLLEKSVSPETLKKFAIDNNWSRCGEMFSCEWMSNLAKICGVEKTLCIDGGLDAHFNCIADCISAGGFALAPYDKMKSFAPGLLNGESAHWALITGIIVIKSSGMSIDEKLNLKPCSCSARPSTCTSNRPVFRVDGCLSEFGIRIRDEALCLDKVTEPTEFSAIYLCAYQGLSSHVSLWPFSTFCASNNNLKKADSKKSEFIILPPGGVEAGLCGKAVLVYPPF